MYTRKEGEGKKKLQKKSVWKQRGPVLNVPLGSVINGADEKGTNGSCIITEPGLCHTNCSRHGALFPAEREAHIACVHTELRAPMCLIRAHKRENTKTDNQRCLVTSAQNGKTSQGHKLETKRDDFC